MYLLILILLLLNVSFVSSQTLDVSRSVEWKNAGVKHYSVSGFQKIDMHAEGVVGDGITPNDSLISSILSTIPLSGAVLSFPAGNFLFNNPVNIPDNVMIKGQGPEFTVFKMNLSGSGNSFNITGSSGSDTTAIIVSAIKDSNILNVYNPTLFSSGDWIQLTLDDADLVTSSWALNTVGQIVEVMSVSGDSIILESPLRMNYELFRSPYIRKIFPAENVGVECLKIKRIDDTAPEQASNICFSYAVNCWLKGIESENCTFSHVKAIRSSNLSITASYFHHGFSYGEGGRAYGVMLQTTTNECLVSNNVFEHLRHSMIVQAGANGNVFAYNYSFDPYWSSFPSNSAGDMVLHGNYVYANLFEQNICQNIVIDNSHGPNGPFNTFFRNRAERYGIFFSASNSPGQNFIGNEITMTSFPFSLVNYTILGNNHFLYGNNNKGTIHPTGTSYLPDSSYVFPQRPEFIPVNQWAGIGSPNSPDSENIPALDRYNNGDLFCDICISPVVEVNNPQAFNSDILIYPNPIHSVFTIESSSEINSISIINSIGELICFKKDIGCFVRINSIDWEKGMYLMLIRFSDRTKSIKKIIK